MAAYKDDKYENDRSYVLGKTMADIVADGLRMDIIQKKIPTGSIITVKEVAERYGVSPMPVRDAFNTLKGEMLLEVSPYKHCKVLSIDRNYVSSIYDIVGALEGLLIEDFMRHVETELVNSAEKINEHIRLISESPDEYAIEEYSHLNTKFHQKLFSASYNEVAKKLYYYYNDTILNTFRVGYPVASDRLYESYKEHKAILDAIRAGDVDRVLKEVREHADKAKKDFLNNDLG